MWGAFMELLTGVCTCRRPAENVTTGFLTMGQLGGTGGERIDETGEALECKRADERATGTEPRRR